MTTDLVQFLRDRLDEDERVAREAARHAGAALATAAAREGAWKPPHDGPEWWNDYDHIFVLCDRPGQPRKVMIADCGSGAFTLTPHIARHDPARILADIEAKRALIKRGDTLFCECDFATSPPTNPDDRSQQIPHHYDCTAYRIAQVLALPYASHPDYRKEWQPAKG